LTKENDDSGVGPAPPETVRMWIELVNRMDAERLENFVTRIRRQWAADGMPELDAAVRARRAALEEKTDR
jgi:hypothetical protein